MPRTIPFAQYLFQRLRQLNCHSIHGVPGDFFLRALDHLPQSRVNWIGNANELCAGYAADAYARVGSQLARHRESNGAGTAMVGALLTTYGVGELSAINAVAGGYAESTPLVSLVATPSRKAMREGNPRRPVHHSLDGRMDVYAEMAKHVTCGQAILHKIDDITTAAEVYDDVLEKAVLHSKPVYVSLSSDMVEFPIAADMLDAKPLNITPPRNDQSLQSEVIKQVTEKLRASQSPLIIADGLSYPFQLQKTINEIVRLTGIPAMSFTSGKGIVDESLPTWDPALPNTTKYSQGADLVLIFGPILSDTNTARWGAIPDVQNTILFNLDSVEIAGKVYDGVRSKELLENLVSQLKAEPQIEVSKSPDGKRNAASPSQTSTLRGKIIQDDLWPMMTAFFKPEDTILLANGTPLLGMRSMNLPPNCQVYASPVWNSIGQMLPAAQGIAVAKRDHALPGRTILFEGDGSFQVTCQSISDLIRYKLGAVIFIANNAGYTYERWLNGMEAEYNDVPSWQYVLAPSFFGARDDPDYPIVAKQVKAWDELLEVMADATVTAGKGLTIIDIVLDPQDVPERAKPGLKRASDALLSA